MPKNNPKVKYKPTVQKKPVIAPLFENNEGTIIFSFQWFDSVSRWGQSKEVNFWDVAEKLKSFEQRQWKHLAGYTKRDHPIEFHKLEKEAQEYIGRTGIFDDHDEIWSLHLDGTKRLWGLKYQRYCMVIWWDPDHKICPSLKN